MTINRQKSQWTCVKFPDMSTISRIALIIRAHDPSEADTMEFVLQKALSQRLHANIFLSITDECSII